MEANKQTVEETKSKKKGCMSDEAKKRNWIIVNVLACKEKGDIHYTKQIEVGYI